MQIQYFGPGRGGNRVFSALWMRYKLGNPDVESAERIGETDLVLARTAERRCLLR
jgi:hypothetical protein